MQANRNCYFICICRWEDARASARIANLAVCPFCIANDCANAISLAQLFIFVWFKWLVEHCIASFRSSWICLRFIKVLEVWELEIPSRQVAREYQRKTDKWQNEKLKKKRTQIICKQINKSINPYLNSGFAVVCVIGLRSNDRGVYSLNSAMCSFACVLSPIRYVQR